jgi:GNAT superfamily N-acetyltransferase
MINLQIAGVIISSHFSKTHQHVELVAKSPLTPLVRSFMIKAEEDADVFGNCGVDEYGEIFIVSVLREFRNCGLATEMFGRAVSMLKEMGYPVIMCMFSNPYSRKLGERFGFKELVRSRYIDAKDEKGNLIMPTATPDQFLNVTVLDLREVKQ